MTRTFNSNCNSTIKFLYSYNGRILLRRSDGKLRYIGGFTRVLSVDRSISFAELMVKFGELCGTSMSLKCKLPNEDLDVLVSINSGEEIQNIIEEYHRVSSLTKQEMKIRAVLFPIKSLKKISPPSSPLSVIDFCSFSRFHPCRNPAVNQFQSPPRTATYRSSLPPAAVVYPASVTKDAGRSDCYRHGTYRSYY